MQRVLVLAVALAGVPALPGAAAAAPQSTPEEWVKLGERVHGGFGTYIALGIRIGQDAVARLAAKPRELDVTLYDGVASPCPCIADGVMIATFASPGQGTLRIAGERAPAEALGVVVIRHRKTGQAVRYVVPDRLRARLFEWNATLEPLGRYKAVMEEPEANLFVRETLSPSHVPK